MSPKTLTYRFRWKDGRRREFAVLLSPPGLRLAQPPRESLPDWTRLENRQCPNCPLTPADSPRCPAAASMADLVELFKDCLSTEVVEAEILTENRDYRKTISAQEGVSSLMGLYMATSGCPILDKLRPMVFTHLPFSTLKETVYRAVSAYLTAQFLRHKKGLPADWELTGFKRLYEDIATVNRAFAKRLMDVAVQDASLNALVKLDCLAGFTAFSIEKTFVRELEELFSAYLRP